MNPEALQQLIGEAAARLRAAEARLAARSGPPAPGDVYMLEQVEWLVVREHPDDPELVCLVPVDDHPLIGGADVVLDLPRVARCGRAVWASVAICTARVGVEEVSAAREMLADLARGRLHPAIDDDDLEYEAHQDVLEWVGEKVGQLLVFEDGNCPGLIYQGTMNQWDGLLREGGFPIRVNPSRIDSDGLVDCGPEGRCPVKRARRHWVTG